MLKLQEVPEKYVKNIILKVPIVRLGILHILSKKPMCGNKIAEGLKPDIKNFPHKINPNILYPLLHGMEKEGFIKGRWEHPKKRTRRIYMITPEGRKMLAYLKRVFKPRFKEIFRIMRNFARELYGKEI